MLASRITCRHEAVIGQRQQLDCGGRADCKFVGATDAGILNHGSFTAFENCAVEDSKGTGAEAQFAATLLFRNTPFKNNKVADVYLKSASDTIYASNVGSLRVRKDSVNKPQGPPGASAAANFLNASNSDFLALQNVRALVSNVLV
jgi:hypothetical protein